jgi:hypothetical protein
VAQFCDLAAAAKRQIAANSRLDARLARRPFVVHLVKASGFL